MKIVICGSMSSSVEMLAAKNELVRMGHEVVLPHDTELYATQVLKSETAHESTQNKIQGDLIRKYFEIIKNSDAVLVVNLDKNGVSHYIGGNSFLEIAFGHVLGKEVYILNELPEMSYLDELRAMQPTILYGDLSRLQ